MTEDQNPARPRRRAEPIEPSAIVVALQARRKELGWSQRRLADEAGLAYSHLGQIFRGRVEPTVLTVERLATVMQMRLALTFHGGGS